jgi:hypothetical protein
MAAVPVRNGTDYLSFTIADAQNPAGAGCVFPDVREKGDLGYVSKIRIERVCGWHPADGIATGGGRGPESRWQD